MFLPRARCRKEHSRVAALELLRRYFTDEFCAMANSVKIVVLNATPARASRLTENHQMTNATTSAVAAVELEGKDLPAHCPNPAMPLWSSHPRVFLEFNHDGVAKCPYCGTAYRLKPGTVVGHH
jgi:uncharacterized Zn-finger protein